MRNDKGMKLLQLTLKETVSVISGDPLHAMMAKPNSQKVKIFDISSEYQLDINFYKNDLRIFSKGKHTGIIRIKHL